MRWFTGRRRAPQAPPPLFQLVDVTHAYDELAIFHALDFTGPRGNLVGVVGESGAGKTTLLNLLAGLDRPLRGTVGVLGAPVPRREGRKLDAHRARVGLVLQEGNLVGHQTAEENVALPLLLRGVSRESALQRARAFLTRLGLAGLEGRYPAELSGGQAQRVAVARALACDARLILADEPTASLDPENSRVVFAALKLAAKSFGRGVVIVSHDPLVEATCDEVLACRAGKLEWVRRLEDAELLDLTVSRPTAPTTAPTTASSPAPATARESVRHAVSVIEDDLPVDSFAGPLPEFS